MKKTFFRSLEILIGIILIIVGIVMLITPGQGLLAIAIGIFLISPHHGKKIIAHAEKLWWRFEKKLSAKFRKKFTRHIPKNWAQKFHKLNKKFHQKFKL
jgi:UPF0716 family protein affecting phage T7 exclusion